MNKSARLARQVRREVLNEVDARLSVLRHEMTTLWADVYVAARTSARPVQDSSRGALAEPRWLVPVADCGGEPAPAVRPVPTLVGGAR